MKKIILLILLSLVPAWAIAIEVEINDIKYDIIKKANVAEVIKRNPQYSGDVVIPSSVIYEGIEYPVTSIGESAFDSCIGLTSVTIPNSVTSIGSSAFYGCYYLTSITIPNSVTNIGSNAFHGCSINTINVKMRDYSDFSSNSFLPSYLPSTATWNYYINDNLITSLDIPNSFTCIDVCAFYNAKGLISVTIPNSITIIEGSAFKGCSGLTSINIPNSVTTIGSYAFYGCSGLTSITISNSITSIGEWTFYGCSGLTSVTIPNSVTNIRWNAFQNCSGLTSVIIPNSVTSIENCAFKSCGSLTSINIPNSVTDIGSEAFAGCDDLTKITIGSGIKSLGNNAFAGCKELTDVYCYAENVPTTKSNVFSNSYIDYATLYVPKGSIENYRNASPWNEFKEIRTLSGEIPETPETKQCAKPTITYENGKIKCTCETENVTYAYTITPTSSSGVSTNGEISLSMTFNVCVYAQREGYLDSEVATTTISLAEVGDMNGDGRLSVEDVTKLVDVIMGR